MKRCAWALLFCCACGGCLGSGAGKLAATSSPAEAAKQVSVDQVTPTNALQTATALQRELDRAASEPSANKAQ